MKLHDTRGTEITIGSTIIYAVHRGSSRIQMYEAVVCGFNYSAHSKLHTIHAKRSIDHKQVVLKQTNTIVVVEPMVEMTELVARVTIADPAVSVTVHHALKYPLPENGKDRLRGNVFPWLVEQAVEKYSQLPGK